MSPRRVLLASLLAAMLGACAPRDGADAGVDASPEAGLDAAPDQEVSVYPLCGPRPSQDPDGCGNPPRPGCVRRCGAEVTMACCRMFDRCVEVSPEGCETLMECTSISDGPCGVYGGPLCVLPGQRLPTAYQVAFVPRSTPEGWPACEP